MNIQSIYKYCDGFVLLFLDDGSTEIVPDDVAIVRDWVRSGGIVEDRQI